jgi:hypothetical protein
MRAMAWLRINNSQVVALHEVAHAYGFPFAMRHHFLPTQPANADSDYPQYGNCARSASVSSASIR